jgi:hypothetical protein
MNQYENPVQRYSSINENMSETSSNDDKRITQHLNFYYRNNEKNTDSYITDSSENPKAINPVIEQNVCCGICNNKWTKGSFIILSCNHVLHVQCLTEKHFVDVYKFAVIDSEYFATRSCPCCGQKLQTEELMFLHSKFLSGTKDRLESHQTAVVGLEDRMNKLKEELKVCYEYKHKLECDREKSKQIVSTLLTMLP